MAVAVSDYGIKMLVKKIDEVYGKHIVTVERRKKGFTPWVALVGASPIKEFSSTANLICYLEGVLQGIQAVKNDD